MEQGISQEKTKSLNYLLPLTHSLQAKAKDIVQAIGNLKDVLSDVLVEVDVYHGQWFTEVENVCLHFPIYVATTTFRLRYLKWEEEKKSSWVHALPTSLSHALTPIIPLLAYF